MIFTSHGDERRKANYLKRHANEDWTDETTAGLLGQVVALEQAHDGSINQRCQSQVWSGRSVCAFKYMIAQCPDINKTMARAVTFTQAGGSLTIRNARIVFEPSVYDDSDTPRKKHSVGS